MSESLEQVRRVFAERYTVERVVGRGGMATVYLANDLKHGREVALKVLPEEFAQDPERMARFEREAKVLASLNHPNIAHLYGLETVNTRMAAGTAAPQDGQASPGGVVAHASRVQAADAEFPSDADAGRTTFLVMELVDGEDLSERIKRGPVPVEEATAIALQIAEALEPARVGAVVSYEAWREWGPTISANPGVMYPRIEARTRTGEAFDAEANARAVADYDRLSAAIADFIGAPGADGQEVG